VSGFVFNRRGVAAIYKFEMARFRRTVVQSIVTPVLTTSLYFVVFGSAIGARMSQVNGVGYGAFIVPGLIMLALFTESLSNASFGIYMPRFTGPSTSCCRRRSPRSKSCSATSEPPPPNRC